MGYNPFFLIIQDTLLTSTVDEACSHRLAYPYTSLCLVIFRHQHRADCILDMESWKTTVACCSYNRCSPNFSSLRKLAHDVLDRVANSSTYSVSELNRSLVQVISQGKLASSDSTSWWVDQAVDKLPLCFLYWKRSVSFYHFYDFLFVARVWYLHHLLELNRTKQRETFQRFLWLGLVLLQFLHLFLHQHLEGSFPQVETI